MVSEEAIHAVMKRIDPEEVIALTAALVRINSVWDPAAGTGEQAAAECVAEWAQRRGFEIQWDEVAAGRPNVILSCPLGAGSRTLMFEGHTDVVTPGDTGRWRFPPFEPRIEGRRLYGRGSNDTKGNLAAMLVAMAAVKEAGVAMTGGLLGGVLCDEEGAMSGVQDFIRRGRADTVTAAVICEPQDGLVCTTQKGAIRARYTVAGRMSHGAMPLAGLNPAPAVARLIEGLHRLESEAVEEVGHHEHLGWPSFTPTVIQAPAAGTAQLNVMPGEAVVLVDVRTVPEQSHAAIRGRMAALARETEREVQAHYRSYDRRLGMDRDRSLAVEVEYLTDRPCTVTAPSEPLVTAAAWATQRVTQNPPRFGGVLGATDGTYLWALKNIPIVTMGAGDRHVPHQVDEWVDLDQLVETARIYALTALRYLWPKDPEGV